ncbi:FAD-dependent thymidylate synthase [Clostridium cylindrosporum]|uniref:Flavin-dependent thymidylate synthase n=1 Tax=Clostridium cylindrosporum DSM 605 TaxID=1121307 RepID=A0A0J8D982_CLOCY|nr:FAD-dependent thymidylate synthase [Clostridium cylindrosporum]KMT22422.1 thymidylate synthase ThyX [Clostridium cylindrosporum DSM 605]
MAKLKVKLIAHTEDPEKIIAASAKLCYSSTSVDNILDGLTEEKTNEFIEMLMSLSHESPIEHVSFTFAVEGVSRSLTHQLVRHRIASYSQQSQRYVRLNQFDYIIPPEIESIDEAKDIYIKSMEDSQRSYDNLVEILFDKHFNGLIKEGTSEESARKIAEKKSIEDARYVFPNACETKIVLTMNARTLFNFFRHRCCSRAQWEIRNLADEMLKEVKSIAPTLFKSCGPSCVGGSCQEGAMSCKEMVKMREKYKNL